MSKTYRVDGMTCGGCARSVETAIKAALPGVTVKVDLAAKKVTVDGADNEKAVAAAVTEAGFDFKGAA
ncbi:MAG: heavy metal transporter [Alphaproteobacteria bacterium RIFOXYD12_FULL_60_8]|nr:MAG: heavy metal transporter [Alphaproteobacteria bacterium RIFOXYD12_FULL_60_8]